MNRRDPTPLGAERKLGRADHAPMKQESYLGAVPFSIAPDAEDYLRNLLNGMPSQARPILMMTERQTDGLNPPRWLYEGESFILGYFDPVEKPDAEVSQCELLGRRVAIELPALKQLSGRVLSLRRVASSRGLMKYRRYVLIADSVPASSGSPEQASRVLPLAALTILGGFTGMGVIWVVSATIATLLKIPLEKLFSAMPPLLVVGWIVGAIISFYFFKSVLKTREKTQFAQEQRQGKYLGQGWLNAELSWWIFLGIPIPLTAILIFAIEPYARTVGEKTGVAVGALVVVFAAAMYFCDRLSQRLILRLGVLGWVFTFALGYWYFKTHGP